MDRWAPRSGQGGGVTKKRNETKRKGGKRRKERKKGRKKEAAAEQIIGKNRGGTRQRRQHTSLRGVCHSMVEDDQVDGWKGRRGGGEEGWRHGNSRLAFNVRRGVPRIAAKLVRKRFKQSDEVDLRGLPFAAFSSSSEEITRKQREKNRAPPRKETTRPTKIGHRSVAGSAIKTYYGFV